MDSYDKIDKLVEENGGTIRTAQIVQEGISKPAFYDYVCEKGYYKAGPGIYSSPDSFSDEMYILHIRFKQAVFSHESALYFHDLTDREPLNYTLTVKTGYNPSRLTENNIKVYTVKSDLVNMGLTEMETPFGHSVPVYDLERTVCDIVRSRSHIEIQVFSDTLKRYAVRKDKDLDRLMEYASAFHIEKLLRQYMEVLL